MQRATKTKLGWHGFELRNSLSASLRNVSAPLYLSSPQSPSRCSKCVTVSVAFIIFFLFEILIAVIINLYKARFRPLPIFYIKCSSQRLDSTLPPTPHPILPIFSPPILYRYTPWLRKTNLAFHSVPTPLVGTRGARVALAPPGEN